MSRPLYQRKGLLLLLGVLVIAGVVGAYRTELSTLLSETHWQDIHETVRASGPWAPVLCILLLALFTILLLPTTLIAILAALLFGVKWGLPICLAGLGLGMSGTFLISRYLVRDGLERRIGDTKLFRRLEENMLREGWKLVLFSRLLPINPFGFLNYAYGLTSISYKHYILASIIGVIPNIIALLWTAKAAGKLATGQMDARVLLLLFAGAGLFALIAWLPRLLRRLNPSDTFLTEQDGLEADAEEG